MNDGYMDAAAVPVPDTGAPRRERVKQKVHGHSVVHISENEWQCKCGVPLGATRSEARKAMPAHRSDLSVCRVDGCDSWPRTNGMCSPHYYQDRRGTLGRVKPSIDERYWSYVEEQENGCWQWTGGATSAGYGQFWITKSNVVRAHRYTYELLVGEVPKGLVLDHLCRNRRCVNPDHLEPVTERVNIVRGTSPSALNAKKTHCKRGHQLTGDNVTINTNGGRECRACRRLRDQEKLALSGAEADRG